MVAKNDYDIFNCHFLSDAGIIPYGDGRYNSTNYTFIEQSDANNYSKYLMEK